jgi:glycosyltransferase involved in cell wall biosynthesis
MMRIAIWHNLGSGGGKRALFNHVKVLKENGCYLESWTTDMSSDYLSLSELIIEHRKGIKAEYDRLLKIKNPVRKENKIFKLINDHCIECIKEIESKQFDLVFANSCCITYMPLIGKFTKLPAIVYLGEPQRFLYEAMPVNIWQTPFTEFKFKKIKTHIKDFLINYSRRIKVRNEIDAAKSYDKILVNSLFSRESLIRAYGLDVTVCYLGIDIEKFYVGDLIKEPYVVGIGSITFLKSVHKAIETISTIPEEDRPVLKWVSNIVDDSYLHEMIDLAKKLKVQFQYFINISDSDLVNIVAKAAIMIYTARLEPFGLAPLEANACGTYVVAMAEGGIRESITNGVNGALINGYKPAEMASVITMYVRDLDLAKIKGEAARLFVSENWNNHFMARNILSELESLEKNTGHNYQN